jgi:hypothetical protein
MNPPRVRYIGSRRIVRPLLGSGASFDARFERLQQEVTEQLAEIPGEDLQTPPLHFVCTTALSKTVSGWAARVQTLFDAVQHRTGVRPSGLVQGYQCAGWGFALRFAAQHMAPRRLMFSIVDADLHDMMSRGYEEAIGGIGFGVTTVDLDLGESSETPRCDGPFANHGFTDLLHALRAQHKRHGPLPTFMPFLPHDLDGLARRMLGDSMAPNQHDHYGHTFGSDPWIGVAKWLQREQPQTARDVLLGAFAYDGYYTAGRMCVGPFTRVALRGDLVPPASTIPPLP